MTNSRRVISGLKQVRIFRCCDLLTQKLPHSHHALKHGETALFLLRLMDAISEINDDTTSSKDLHRALGGC